MWRVFLFLFLTACFGTKEEPKVETLRIGTGPQLGVYYTIGLGIADLVNESYSGAIAASIDTTEGSSSNIEALERGDVDLALVQADNQFQAFYGKGRWENRPLKQLRFVCSLFVETVTCVASSQAKISRLEDLRYKSVNIGPPQSGSRINAIEVLHSVGVDERQDLKLLQKEHSEAALLLSDGRIDAMFLTVGHPNTYLAQASNGPVPVRFIPIDVTAVGEAFPYFQKASIPVHYYPRVINTEDMPTVGVLTTLLVGKDVSDDLVYKLTQTLFDRLDALKAKHPALGTLSRANALEGQFYPIHPGALRYYRETGMTK